MASLQDQRAIDLAVAGDVCLPDRPRPRPLLWPAIGLMVGITASAWLGPLAGVPRILLLAAPLAPGIALLLIGKRNHTSGRRLAVWLSLLAALVGMARQQVIEWRPGHHLCHALTEEPVLTRLVGTIVTGPIERPPIKRNQFLAFEPPARTQFVLRAEQLRTADVAQSIAGQVRVTLEAGGLGLRLGERVQLTGRLYHPRGPRNPGELDWSRWYRQQGLDAGLVVEGAEHAKRLGAPGWSWWRVVAGLRDRARSLLFEPQADFATDESLRLLDVMVLGQRSVADRRLNEAFLRAGGMHFLAVSGFHVGVLAAAVWWLVRRALRRGPITAAGAMLLVTVLYTMIAEPNAPILRAAVFAGLLAAGMMLRRPTDVVNTLALAAIGILLFNPRELFRAGFQLSFVQVLGLVTVVPAVMASLRPSAPPAEAQTLRQLVVRKLRHWLWGLMLVCVCAWLVSLPLTAWHFGRIAPWGWLGTLMLTPLVALTIVLSLLTTLVSLLPGPLSAGLGAALHWTTTTLLRCVSLFENLPAAVVERAAPPVWLVSASYAALLVWVLRRPEPPASRVGFALRRAPALDTWRTIATVSIGALLLLAWTGWLVLPSARRGGGYTVHVLAVGNGAAVLAAAPDGRAVLYDVGTDTNTDAGEVVAGAARELGIRRLDALLLSHANFDHYSGLPTLLHRLPVQRRLSTAYWQVAADSGRLAPLLAQLPTELRAVEALKAGDRLSFGEMALEVLWPPEGLDARWTTNDCSLVVRLNLAGRTVLLPGDVEAAGMRALLEAERDGRVDLRADVLLAPHHGAVLPGVTADFLAAVSPRLVIVSTRTPRPRLAQLARDVLGPQITVLETADSGAVTVRAGAGEMLRVETPFAARADD